MAVSHWRETPQHGAVAVAATGGVEGVLPLDRFQPRPAVVSLKLAWGRIPTRGNLYHFSFTAFITLHETYKNLQNQKTHKNLHN